MKKFYTVLIAAFLLAGLQPAQAKLVTKEIAYDQAGTKLKGYFVYDDAVKAPMPGVVLFHEWWGYNDYARSRAEQVAALGYAVFAADMYGEGKIAATPEEATKMSKPFYDSRELMRARAHAALQTLMAQPQVDTSKLAAMGYCFGGTVALELGRAKEPLKGIVSFHGGLATPEPAKTGDIKGDVLALNGADDEMVKADEKAAFEKEMNAGMVPHRTIEYPGAKHAFTNPDATEIGEKFNIPVAYNKEADEKSWEEMKTFYQRIFK